MSKSIKLVMIGDTSVGKSSIISRYINNKFDDFQASTIGASFFHREISGYDFKLSLEIWDTAGQERYKSLLPLYYRSSNVILMVYDCSNYQSLYNINHSWIAEIKQHCDNPNFYLVSNKIDLPLEESVTHQNQNLVNSILNNNNISNNYFEVSAKTGQGISQLFQEIVEKSVREKNFRESLKKLTISNNQKSYSKCC